MTSVVNEMNAKFAGAVGLSPFFLNDSASRLAMFCSHIGQSLVMKHSSINRILTGMEREYGKDVFAARFPCRAVVYKVIEKYPETIGGRIVGENPLTTVIYENVDSPQREFGVLNIHKHHCMHQYYGFNYVRTDDFYRLAPGAHIDAETVVATSPSITREGDYKYGLNAQVAFMSHASVIEDGVIASESVCKRMATKGYGTRTVSWGKTSMPVNLFGSETEYKPFPNVGERVGEDGMLFASRHYDDTLAPALMSSKALRVMDYFDKPIHAMPNAKIIDVVVLKGNKEKTYLPTGMDAQCRYYYEKSLRYYQELMDVQKELGKRFGDTVRLSPRLHQMMVHAESIIRSDERRYVTHTYHRQTVDEWIVQITFEYDVIPGRGYKITGMDGDKGVICAVWPDEWMPVDADGTRADFIMDGDSTFKRMNVGRFWRHAINACGHAMVKRVREWMVQKPTGQDLEHIWQYVRRFYEIVSPPMVAKVDEAIRSDDHKLRHLEKLVKDGHYLYIPTDNPRRYPDVLRELREAYPPCYGPVTYRDDRGMFIQTKDKVLIGELYILLLEKTGHDWSAVSSAKLQHYGIPAKQTNVDKYANAGRHSSTRTWGESEYRRGAAACGGDAMAEISDRNNNPSAHRNECENLLAADRPTDIEESVDRREVPRGGGRVVTFVNHTLRCNGIEFVKGNG